MAAGRTFPQDPTLRFDIDFLLLPGFSMIAFSSAIEPLRLANKILQRPVFRYRCSSIDGLDTAASNGLSLRVDSDVETVGKTDLMVVCGGDGVENVRIPPSVSQAIRRLAHGGVSIAGICTGPYVLAELGLLSERTCTIHWEYAEILQERFPTLHRRDTLFERDGGMLTCAGGAAAMDLMINFIAEDCGIDISGAIADLALHQDVRLGFENQRKSPGLFRHIDDSRVQDCVRIMEEHLEEPLSAADIAKRAGITVRQLQRRFRRTFDETPMDFYLKLRLEAARRLITRTSMPIVDIAVTCGFTSASHFTRRYRHHMGVNPIDDRRGFYGDGGP